MTRRVAQAGGIAFRTEGDHLVVLLVRSKKDPSIWVLPKGHIEDGETAAAAAVRETWEEAGVEGELGKPVGPPLEFQSGEEAVSVQYFLIRAATESPSPEGRDKQWLSIDKAMTTLAFENVREVLREAAREMTLDSGPAPRR